jgi:hypothetical protein
VAWRLLLVAELGNACDWATTLIGVARLHLVELNPHARLFIRAVGAPWGITLFKAAVGFELAGMAAAAVWIAGRHGRRAGALCLVALAVAGALLWWVAAANAQTLLVYCFRAMAAR